MGYINEFRGQLQALIAAGKTEEAVKFAADKALESYRNGLEAGAAAEPRERQPRRFAKRSRTNANAPRE